MAAATWDARWSLHAPPTAQGARSNSNYASWRRRVQALLEVESVWEVVSESVVFDEAWPLAKQLEFVQKDKLGMHLILSTMHDSAVALLDSSADACNRSWLMLQRLERVFAAHRMQTVRSARREFLALRFSDVSATAERDTATTTAPDADATEDARGDDDSDAMLRFIERVQTKGDALAQLRGSSGASSTSSYSHDDELMYQLLDALPPSWASFVALECETDGALTWTTAKRKVLAEYTKRRTLRALNSSSSNATLTVVSTGATTSAPPSSVGSSSASGVVLLDSEPLELEQRLNGDTGAVAAADPAAATKSVVDELDLRSPVDDDDEVDEMLGTSTDDLRQQHEELALEASYYDQHQPQHYARPKYPSNTLPYARHRRDATPLTRPTPYARPTMTASGEKICFYCSTPGHLAHLCPLKRMHWEARKKSTNSSSSNNSSSGYRHHHHHHSTSSQQQ